MSKNLQGQLRVDQRSGNNCDEYVIYDNDEQCEENKNKIEIRSNNEYDDEEVEFRSEHEDKFRENRYKKKYR
jgi:hypothetical protein